jgi:HSP20 family protein
MTQQEVVLMAEKKLVRWTPWEPFPELSSFSREMDRLWGRFFREGPLARTWEREWTPSLDLSETEDSFIVRAEVPGVEAKDINISLLGNVLIIKGEKKEEREDKKEDYHFVERWYGTFSRSVRFPEGVESGKSETSYNNGVLKIKLPKSEEAKKKEIKIKVE